MSYGWWAIDGAEFMRALRMAADGTDPDLVYAEFYANSEVHTPLGEEQEKCDQGFGDWDCAACGNTISACSWFRDGGTTCCDKCDHSKGADA